MGFFIHMGEENKWYCTFVSLQVVFFIQMWEENNRRYWTFAGLQMVLIYSHRWRKKIILHIRRLTTGFFSTNIGDKTKWYFPHMCIFFNSNNNISHLQFHKCFLNHIYNRKKKMNNDMFKARRRALTKLALLTLRKLTLWN